ncbi:MAG: FixH family protein [Bacteroidota bacterium]
MSWGNKIVIAYVLFVGYIGYLVYGAFQEDFDLVTEDYYAQELQYQSKIDQLKNARELGIEFKVSQVKDSIQLTFPLEIVAGNVHFYHPSTKAYDRRFALTLKDGKQLFDRKQFIAGNYRVNIAFQKGGKEYLQESKFFIR